MAKRMSDEAFENLMAIGFGKPPRWCANSVATDKGWTNPKTGEVVLASRGLASRINEFEVEKKKRADEAAKKDVPIGKIQPAVIEEVEVVEVLKIEDPVVEEVVAETVPVTIEFASEVVEKAPTPKTSSKKSGKKTKALADKTSKE